jgi:hypothetical protein
MGARALIAGCGALIAQGQNAGSPAFDRDLIELKSKMAHSSNSLSLHSLFRDGGSISFYALEM